ncbi:tumor necrosis factor ligand superfamily member 10-like [Physella acuta]|uniref:tumor necrosis factor ligand superfamily member 10-like n=1 Tax=Physella acuta TaxID=109671 RepID=UPI0027DD559C|nr:tumor necrosis factor ligand superfamily member 10-like [Physella acuta]XP_059142050.1 tumor necrosis factor ligand superfamily member 10-like [Physella acuta]XP_059142051.1 tumor necrosis factor ligand superfamily member 10-like [Physella acuta]XP_059142053.1 tumor necrosis factor ligand superfamily member 10-like [Physella acuta]XP_059142054.1 tumor necrosis factor ligand superfamily member 10-like [Physella acuta]XP_059142055.1 tumor necrosis factor ligand superfamily member 10-like [Phy
MTSHNLSSDDSEANLMQSESDSSSLNSNSSNFSIRSGSVYDPAYQQSSRITIRPTTQVSCPPTYPNSVLSRPLPSRPAPGPPLPPPLSRPVTPCIEPLVRPTIPHNKNYSHRRKPRMCLLRRRTLIVLSTVSLFLSLVAVTLLGLLYFDKEPATWESGMFKEGDYETCIECSYFFTGSGDPGYENLLKQLTNKMEKGKTQCCARTSGQLSALVELMTLRQQSIKIPNNQDTDKFKFSPVSAHISFKESEENLNKENRAHLELSAEIKTDPSGRQHAREVIVKKNFITIKHSGWYFVYSSIFYQPSSEKKTCKQYKFQTWMNHIVRNSYSRPEFNGDLSSAAHTCCDTCDKDYHTSYTGAVFNLLEGDSIYVEKGGDGKIKYESEASYFGLVMLGSNEEDEKMKQLKI